MTTSQHEKVYYQSPDVLITSARAEMAGKTFVMSNITSVNMVSIAPNRVFASLLLFLGMPLLIMGAGLNDSAALVLGIIALVLGFLWYRALKMQYAVNLSSASGETRVVQSTNGGQIWRIVSAIKQAIIDGNVGNAQATTTGQMMPSSDNYTQKLTSLKGLLDSGVLSQQEYEAKKTEILSRI